VNQSIVYEQGSRPGCLIQLLWFAFVGWWFGLLWVSVAWFLNVTVIGMPIGAAMLNNVPMVIALRGRRLVNVSSAGQVTGVTEIPFIIRAIYFVLIGWWLSATWMAVAYALCMTIILLPVGFWMFDLTPMIVSLKRI
jgi:uncharacterized membrane protein YccF (DUF307 family)